MYHPKMYFPPHHKKHCGLLVFYTNLHHCQNKLSHGALFLSAFISPHWYNDVCDCVYLNMYGATISVYTICMCVDLPRSQVLCYFRIDTLRFQTNLTCLLSACSSFHFQILRFLFYSKSCNSIYFNDFTP